MQPFTVPNVDLDKYFTSPYSPFISTLTQDIANKKNIILFVKFSFRKFVVSMFKHHCHPALYDFGTLEKVISLLLFWRSDIGPFFIPFHVLSFRQHYQTQRSGHRSQGQLRPASRRRFKLALDSGPDQPWRPLDRGECRVRALDGGQHSRQRYRVRQNDRRLPAAVPHLRNGIPQIRVCAVQTGLLLVTTHN